MLKNLSNVPLKPGNNLTKSRQILKELSDAFMHSRDLHVPEGKRVFVRLPPPSSTANGEATRFLRKYDGPYLVTGHVHGSEDLLCLQHLSTGKEIRVVNIEKIVVVPDSDFRADLRDDTEQEQTRGTVASSLPKSTVASPVNRSSDLAKIAFAFAKYLSSLPQVQCYASEACKAVYNKDILNRHGKLKGLVRQCPYLFLQGGPPPCFECKAIW